VTASVTACAFDSSDSAKISATNAVEELMSAHPDIKESAVVGMPDTDLRRKNMFLHRATTGKETDA
jgi:acyl-coenzyme A synthetase/AMP-(fatty) acid ligase